MSNQQPQLWHTFDPKSATSTPAQQAPTPTPEGKPWWGQPIRHQALVLPQRPADPLQLQQQLQQLQSPQSERWWPFLLAGGSLIVLVALYLRLRRR
jgi:hypothetical protein